MGITRSKSWWISRCFFRFFVGKYFARTDAWCLWRNLWISDGKSKVSEVCHALVHQPFIFSPLRSATVRSVDIHQVRIAICIIWGLWAHESMKNSTKGKQWTTPNTDTVLSIHFSKSPFFVTVLSLLLGILTIVFIISWLCGIFVSQGLYSVYSSSHHYHFSHKCISLRWCPILMMMPLWSTSIL